MYDELAQDVNAIQTNDTSNFVRKAYCNTANGEIENKTPSHDNNLTTQEFNKLTRKVYYKIKKSKISKERRY